MQEVKLLLAGNPNAGKSTLFNKLTGGHAKVGNWHGVTVGVLEKRIALKGGRAIVCDLPGIYAENALSLEEKLAVSYLKKEKDAPLAYVCECASLDRSLPLFFRLAAGRRAILVLTKEKRFSKEGGFIDKAALSKRLGTPVLSAEKLSRKELLKEANALLFPSGTSFAEKKIKSIKPRGKPRTCSSRSHVPPQAAGFVPFDVAANLPLPASKFASCIDLDATLFRPARAGFSRADQLLTSGWFCIPFFFLLLLSAFFITFYPNLLGDCLKRGLESLFKDFLGAYAEKIPSPVLRSFVKDGILASLGGVLGFLPQISLLYLVLILLEESGLFSRLAALSDGAFQKVGLNGRAVFSLLMGFGCTAAAIAATRGLDDKKMQRRVILCLPYLSCSAKLPVYLALASSFFENPFIAVVLLYAFGAALSFLAALFFKEEKRELFILELAPLQIPRPVFVVKSLLFQIKQFIIKVATVIAAFFMISWLCSSFTFSFAFCTAEESMLATICGGFKYLFAPIGMNDWKVAYAALSGIIAKENVAGSLYMFFGEAFPFGARSAFAFAIFMLATSPCVSAIAASAREIGKTRAILCALIQTASALLLSYIAYFALSFGTACVFVLPVLFIFLFVGKHTFENVRRKRKRNIESLHRQRIGAGVLSLPHSLKRGQNQSKRKTRKRRRSPSKGRQSRLSAYRKRRS